MPKWLDARKDDQAVLRELRPRDALCLMRSCQPDVRRIVEAVRDEGDKALNLFRRRFDHPRAKADDLWVSEEEVEEAYKEVGEDFLGLVRKTARRIREHHKRQLEGLKKALFRGATGVVMRPISRVGAYIPGGRFPYPSTALMTIIPAKVAGVGEVVAATPPGRGGKVPAITLVALKEAGADRILRAGGAHAVAALAFGTESVPKVDKVVGPGGTFVTLAKLEVYGEVGVDMLAGPSEVAVVADGSQPPKFAASDLLAQVEHDPLARGWLITPDEKFAREVERWGARLIEGLPQPLKRAWAEQVFFVLSRDLRHAVELANLLAPEHLEIQAEAPRRLLRYVKDAGAIFLGPLSSAVMGDYVAGPSHVLPTGGAAVYRSALGVWDFVKFSTVVDLKEPQFKRLAPMAVEWARREGMEAHRLAVEVRLEGARR